ncbi:hypothetical protein IPM19_00660 [bacterium]|nr:MAG: hypothetical protein IPM19_00660 [bacterium]
MERSSIFTQVILTIIFATGILFAGVLPTTAQVEAPNTCMDPAFSSRFAPVSRQWNFEQIDHFYSNNSAETAPGYKEEQPLGYLINNADQVTVPLYRYYSAALTDHFYSVSDEAPAGYANEGILGYVFVSHREGTVPIYRLYRHEMSPLNGDHLYTTSASERDLAAQFGYVYEGIEGYVCPM